MTGGQAEISVTRYVPTHAAYDEQQFLPMASVGRRRTTMDVIRRFLGLPTGPTPTTPPPNLLLISGLAGSGKSRMLDVLIRQARRHAPGAQVVCATPATLVEDPVQCFIDTANNQLGLTLGSEDELLSHVHDGRIIPAIDGLDEVSDGQDGDSEFSHLLGMIGKFLAGPSGSCICTVRRELLLQDQARREALKSVFTGAPSAAHCDLQGLQFLEAVCFFAPEEVASDDLPRYKQIKELWYSAGLQSWFRRPLMMFFLSRLPADRTYSSVYECFDALANEEARGVNDAISKTLDSWTAHERFGRRSGKEPTFTITDPAVGKHSTFLKAFAGNQYRVRHRTVLDYYAARRIASRYNEDADGRARFSDFFFHWDSREFIVHAMRSNQTDYREALCAAVVGPTLPKQLRTPFESYAELIEKPGQAQPNLVFDLTTSLFPATRAAPAGDPGTSRFLSYVVHDFRVLMLAGLPISGAARESLQRILKAATGTAMIASAGCADSYDGSVRLCLQAVRACRDLATVDDYTKLPFDQLRHQLLTSDQGRLKQEAHDALTLQLAAERPLLPEEP